MSGPRISVVISSYRRPVALARLLQALAVQRLDRSDFEVIVVNNGAGAETASVLRTAAQDLPLALETVELSENAGPAGGRNHGWRRARAPWVAFTDDDCRPSPGWLAELLAVAEDAGTPPMSVLQGPTLPEPADLARVRHTLFCRIVSVRDADGRFETCNIVYPRRLLERLDGFDERFVPRGVDPRPVGEDTDLGWRARATGASSRFVPRAVVFHDVTDLGPVGTLRHATRWAGAVHLFAVHPSARQILFRRCFWNVWHYMLVQALVATVAPAWLRRRILSRYARALGRRARECGAGPWAIPYLITHDATEAGALILASCRERTLVI